MKKFLCGVMLVVIGFLTSGYCLIYAINNPYVINGVDGLIMSLKGTDTGIPFLIYLLIMIVGLFICFYEAYGKTK